MDKWLLLIALLGACARETDKNSAENGYENYGDIYQKNGQSFILNATGHGQGWGHATCILCHQLQNIHRVDRVDAISVDIPAIQATVESEGLASCSRCHGANGVTDAAR